jgi:hypothetical protein
MSPAMQDRLCFPAVYGSGIGTFETSRHVRCSDAIEGKPAISRTTHFGSEGPLTDIRALRASVVTLRSLEP